MHVGWPQYDWPEEPRGYLVRVPGDPGVEVGRYKTEGEALRVAERLLEDTKEYDRILVYRITTHMVVVR